MRAALRIAAKDLRLRMRDRSALMLALLLPFALAFVFNLVFGSGGRPAQPFTYAVVDLDRGPVAAGLVSGVLPELQRRGLIQLRTVDSPEKARALAARGAVDAAFVVPAGFGAAVQSRRAAQVGVVASPSAPVAAEVARSIAASYTAELNAAALSVAAATDGRAVPADQLPALVRRAVAQRSPVALVNSSAAERVLDVKTYFAAGMAVFFLFFTVQFGVSSLLDERSGGTLARLLAAPVPRGAVLAGKLLTSLVLGVVSMGALVVSTTLLLGARWGDPVGVAVLIVAGVLAATGVTALVASLARTSEQAGSWQAVIATTLGVLGGSFFPIAQVGGAATALSLFTPHAWIMRGLADLAGGGGVRVVLPAVGALLAFALVTGAVAATRLGRAVRL
jgi:ABC-2 type transport system permease protein